MFATAKLRALVAGLTISATAAVASAESEGIPIDPPRSDVPVYVGFGISTAELARAAGELADGVVVGSRAVEVAETGPEALRDFVASLRAALDS